MRADGSFVRCFICSTGRSGPITVEAIGDDEAGVDLWIERKDGVREAQQCKIGNSANPDWSMAALNQRRILQYLRRQLERDRSYQFALISSVPAVTLQALSLSARDSTGDPQDFYAHQVKRRSPKLKTAFSDFCRYLELGPEQPNDIASAFDILQRSDFHLFSDDQKTRDDMRAWAGYLVERRTCHYDCSNCRLRRTKPAQTNLRGHNTGSSCRPWAPSTSTPPRQPSCPSHRKPANSVQDLHRTWPDRWTTAPKGGDRFRPEGSG